MRPVLLMLLLATPAAAAPPVVIEVPAPGASADVVADVVAVPLDRQLLGTPGVRHVRTLAADGRCLVRLDVDPKADRAGVRSEVTKRIALADPRRPEAVHWENVRLRPDAEDAVIAVAVKSDGRADIRAMSAAAERLRPRLATVPQVADVVAFGAATVGLRMYVDADKLAARNLTPTGLIAALRAAIAKKAPTADQLGEVVVSEVAGQPVLVRDVAVVEEGVSRTATAGVVRPGGESVPAVLLLVRPAPGAVAAVTAAVGKLLDTSPADLPPGVTLERRAFGTGDTAVALRLPASTEPDRRDHLIREAATAAGRTANVRAVAWLSGPGDAAGTLLIAGVGVKLSAEALGSAVVAARVGRTRWPLDDWPGDGATIVARVSGEDAVAVMAAARELREQVGKANGVAAVTAEPHDRPRVRYDIDRAKVATLGMTVDAVNEAIEFATTGLRVGPVIVAAPPAAFRGGDDLRTLRLANKDGARVPLGTIVAVRDKLSPAAVYCEDGRPCRVVACDVRGREVAAVRADVRAAARQMATAGVTIVIE
jgi:multidrug efflux pump subunit AcrB